MTMINLALAAAMLIASASVQPSSNTAAPAAANPAQRICVRSDFTGTRIARTICRTRAEWERSGDLAIESNR